MKIADLVTEMRMNKMPLLLNMLKKKEFGYLQQVYLSTTVSNYMKQSNCQNNRVTKTILLNTGGGGTEQINGKKKKKKKKKKLNWLSHCL